MTYTQEKSLRIGISSNVIEDGHLQLRKEYIEAVCHCGAIPVIIPTIKDTLILEAIVKDLDGVILSGGYDIDSSFFGEFPSPHIGEVNVCRDRCEFEILRLAMEHKIPIFGICRGLQIINVAFGGSLYQDIVTDIKESLVCHQQSEPTDIPTHAISVVARTKTASIMPKLECFVNSHHHQSIKKLGNGLLITAFSSDGIIEGIEATEHDIIGVQFHPERLPQEGHAIIANWIKKIVASTACKEC